MRSHRPYRRSAAATPTRWKAPYADAEAARTAATTAVGDSIINGDTELAHQGDPETGEARDGSAHEHHIWHVDTVKALVANQDEAVTFFCGGSRNFSEFIDLFDGVFVLEVDLDTLNGRLYERMEDEWGGNQKERELIVRLHQTKEDIPKNGIIIDATASVSLVVDEIIRQSETNE